MFLDSLRKDYKRIRKRKDKRSLPVNCHIFLALCKCRLLPRASSSFSSARRGSLTLEAACILPMFLSLVLLVMSFFSAIQIQGSIMAGLGETAKELAVSAYAGENGIEPEEIQGLILGQITNAFVKKRLLSRLQDEGIDFGIVEGGFGGISLAESSYDQENRIRIRASYGLRLPALIPGLGALAVSQEGSVRAWVGREENAAGNGSAAGEAKTVYVAATGRVYHLDSNCTHIRLSVRKIGQNEIAGQRNQSGGKYAPCESCGAKGRDEVYITDTGDRYHSSASCSGLKRTVAEVLLSELDGWEPCSRCGG